MDSGRDAPSTWRWEEKRDKIVTDGGATIDFFRDLGYEEYFTVTDDDVVHLLTPGVKRVVLLSCVKLTDAAITAVAEKCPNLAWLNVSECKNLTDASIKKVAEKCPTLAKLEVRHCHKLTDAAIVAVAEKCANLATLDVMACENLTDATITAVAKKCPNLAELYVSWCKNITDAAITAVAEKCPNLAALSVALCENLTDAAITVVAEKCANLVQLHAQSCGLTALPDNIGNLSKLKGLNLANNKLTALPRSIVELDASCFLFLYNNPLQTPPYEVARQGIPAIRRYFEQLDAGAVVATQLKMVLCGDAEAGKTSLRNAFAGRQSPRQKEKDRTIHLDCESVRIPVEGDDEIKALILNIFDLGGQENYVNAQAPFLTRSALFVLVVEAEKACDRYADEAVLRFITLIQTRVSDATVQLVLSKVDKLKDGDVQARREWLRRVVNDRLEEWRKAVQRRNMQEGKPNKEIPMIHVEKDVLPVSVAEELSHSEGVDEIRDTIVRLALSKSFPTVGQKIPSSWFEVWKCLRAIAEHGDESKAIEAMLEGTATKPLGVDDRKLSVEGMYRPLDDLRAAWSIYCERIGKKNDWRETFSDVVTPFLCVAPRRKKDDPDTTFYDALQLLEAQGGLFVDAGLAFLQPQLIINLMKPLVDHTLTVKSDKFEEDLNEFLASHELISETTLRNQLESFAQAGELGREALVFLWRGLPHVKHEHYGQILRVLHGSGIIFVQKRANGDKVAVVFSHLPSSVPKLQLAAAWTKLWWLRLLGVFRDMTVEFDSGGCPPSFVQRVLAATHEFGVSVCAWRKGVVVHHDAGRLYVRLVGENSPKPKLVFSVRTVSNMTNPQNWFPRVIELLKIEAERLPGMDCQALVCCPGSECPQRNTQVVVWASKKAYSSNAVCGCGTSLLGTAALDPRMSARALLELLVHEVLQIRPAIKAAEERIIDTMVDLANDAHQYPSLFYVVPVQPSSGEGLMRRARSMFEEEMMIVFVCAESMKAVMYGNERGLKFSVLRGEYRAKVVAAAKFWKEYGWVVKAGAKLVTAAVAAAAHVKLEELVSSEVSSVVGAVATMAEFIEKYSGMINDAVDKGRVYVDIVEKLEKRRRDADPFTGRDENGASLTDEEKKKIQHKYNADLKDFFKDVGYKRNVMEKTMEYRRLPDGKHGWALKK